jgi:hypothetical protein
MTAEQNDRHRTVHKVSRPSKPPIVHFARYQY